MDWETQIMVDGNSIAQRDIGNINPGIYGSF